VQKERRSRKKCCLSLFVFEVNDLTHHDISGKYHEQNDLALVTCFQFDQISSRLAMFRVVGTFLKLINQTLVFAAQVLMLIGSPT